LKSLLLLIANPEIDTMKAYKHLVRYSLNAGHTVSVFDGELWEVENSTDYKAIIDCIESVEEANIVIRDTEDKKLGWALVTPFGVDDEETVCDYTVTDYMEKWSDTYDNPTNERDQLIRAARELSTGIHGSFAAGIGDAALRADSHNLKILVDAFPDVFAKATGTETI
jgi:hypothetical protein